MLVGGRSLRMGSDKAFLPWKGTPLAAHVATTVHAASGQVKLVGDPVRYGGLGFPVIPDIHAGCGPLAGVETALRDTESEWNLVVACDMPDVSAQIFTQLFDYAETSDADVVMPVGSGGRYEPLCAVWHRRALGAVETALASGIRKMTDVLPSLRHAPWLVGENRHFKNLNTPEDWSDYAAR